MKILDCKQLKIFINLEINQIIEEEDKNKKNKKLFIFLKKKSKNNSTIW